MIMPPTWIEISASSFLHNIFQYKKILGSTALGLVVKSNAYGHGLPEIAQLSNDISEISWLCTASLSEALRVREHVPYKNILVMTLIDCDPIHAINQDIDLMVQDHATIDMLNAIGEKIVKPAYVHLKIDTGMSRFGVTDSQAACLAYYAQAKPYINVRGIYTHFSESDKEEKDFTQQQMLDFNRAIALAESRGLFIPIKHASNSAAALTLPAAHYNLARIGAGAYGLWPSESVKKKVSEHDPSVTLKPILTWKTQIVSLRTVADKSYVGYARSYQTEKPTVVAIVPVGYYEGYDRRLSNKGIVTIEKNGHLFHAPVIGRVCMNATMIDVTHIPNIALHDQVVLLGDYPPCNAIEIANKIGSYNPREMISRILPTIERRIVP